MQYETIFFDLDHTLWDFDANAKLTLTHLYNDLQLEERGITDFEKFYQQYLIHNDKLWERYRNGFINQAELRVKRMRLTLLDFKIADAQLENTMSELFLANLPSRNLLFPHTIELLEYLSNKNYRLHLITNGFEKVQHQKVENSGLKPFFGEIITSERAQSLKPHKEIFEYAFTVTSSHKDSSIMVGDTLDAEILGGQNAGIDQVFVNHTGKEIASTATYTVHNLEALKSIF